MEGETTFVDNFSGGYGGELFTHLFQRNYMAAETISVLRDVMEQLILAACWKARVLGQSPESKQPSAANVRKLHCDGTT